MTADPPRSARAAWPAVLLVLLTACWARADAFQRGRLIVRGRDEHYWIVTTTVDLPPSATRPSATLPADPPTVTTVRHLVDPVAGTWAVDGSLGVPVATAAPLDDGLAVLTASGEWRLLADGRSVIGPVPPDGLTLTDLADGHTALWALARASDRSARLLAWSAAGGWSVVATLPPGCTADAALAVYDGVPYVAFPGGGGVHVARLDTPALRSATGPATSAAVPPSPWSAVGPPLPAGVPADDCGYVNNAPAPLFWSVLGNGRSADQVALFDLRTGTAVPFRTLTVENAANAGFAVVGPSLRAVTLKDGRLRQTAVDDAGHGVAHDPVTLAEPAPAAEAGPEWANLIVLSLITALTFTTLRPRPDASAALAAALGDGLTIAPRGRRLAAGLIDLIPVLVVAYWAVRRFEGTPDDIANSPTRFFLPIFAAGCVYLAHVTICEWRTGRSVGKWATGLRVTTLGGQRPTGEQVIVRNLLRAVDCVGLAVLIVVTPLGQRLGDLAAKTVVVAGRPES